jgi:hypothetical protein
MKLEIKTSEEIFWDFDHEKPDENYRKWVSVDSEIEFLKKLFDAPTYRLIEQRIKELKGGSE